MEESIRDTLNDMSNYCLLCTILLADNFIENMNQTLDAMGILY
jgi:hypothetical protein